MANAESGKPDSAFVFLRDDGAVVSANLVRRDYARSKRSRFITLVHAAAKSFTNFAFESALA
jgi:hypothetical protein